MRKLLDTLLLEKNGKISGGIYNKLQVDFAYNSNHIEGSCLTHEQTRYIFETKTIGAQNARVNDIFETANHFKCFAHILDTVFEPLTEVYIKNLHGMLKAGVLSDGDEVVIGDYKKYPNEVGGNITSLPKEIPEKITNLIANTRSPMTLYDIISFHANFEKIHPFYDGNGRIGRLLMFKQCLENDIVPFFIDDLNKMFYYMGLKEWQNEDKKIRLIDTCLLAQDDMKAILDIFEIDFDKVSMTYKDVLSQNIF